MQEHGPSITTPLADKSMPDSVPQGAPAGGLETGPLHWVHDVPGPTRRWWLGVIGGALFSLPLAWLLSYAAALPFYLGLFFFMLFGLMIGALAYRIAAPGKPYATSPLLLGTSLLVALPWGLSIVKEARDFPDDFARRVSHRTRDLGAKSPQDFRAAVAGELRSVLAERYGPGPVWGYIRWILTSGQLKRGDLTSANVIVSVPAAQRRGGWAFRVVASAGLLAFGVASQTFSLRARAKKD